MDASSSQFCAITPPRVWAKSTVRLACMPAAVICLRTASSLAPNWTGSGVSATYSGTPTHTANDDARWIASAIGL